MISNVLLFAGIWTIIGTTWFIIHLVRVKRQDKEQNRSPLSPRGWEWIYFFVCTVVLWPIAIHFFLRGRKINCGR